MSRPRQRSRWPLRPLPFWIALLLLAIFLVRFFQSDPPGPPPMPEPARPVRVERVVDGDTLLLDGGVRVRLIGVDTPETVRPDHPVEPFGPEASDFTERMVEGRFVTLEFDRERRDRYGRVLAYVYDADGRMLNEELIRAGFSPAETQYPYRSDRKRLFQQAEDEARSAGRGLWGE
jgi:micrococcal nuclease